MSEYSAALTFEVGREMEDDFADLTAALASSLEFWNNPLDDEDWNMTGREE